MIAMTAGFTHQDLYDFESMEKPPNTQKDRKRFGPAQKYAAWVARMMFIQKNIGIFKQAAGACKTCGCTIPPELLIALYWDERNRLGLSDMLGLDKLLSSDPSVGPFQIKPGTAHDVAKAGEGPAKALPKETKALIQKLETDLLFAASIAKGRLCQIVDHWSKNKGPDLCNRWDILGTLYSIGLAGKKGVHKKPKPSSRGTAIKKWAQEAARVWPKGAPSKKAAQWLGGLT